MSRYLTLYDVNGIARFQNLGTSGVSARSTQLTSRRITITTGAYHHHVAFGTSTVVATTASAVIPAFSVLDFNFVPGQYVAAISGSAASFVTIIDCD